MIGVNPTKIQLNADDLAEYESAKSRWRRAPAKSFPRKLQSQQKEAAPDRQERSFQLFKGICAIEHPASARWFHSNQLVFIRRRKRQ
mmetsp:Transcript_16800/g.37284  ORF Transcript_16800/g.37284 Transcript_16800/m.37284 type:complete len:87 (-) Transcript_16800:222-482(-)